MVRWGRSPTYQTEAATSVRQVGDFRVPTLRQEGAHLSRHPGRGQSPIAPPSASLSTLETGASVSDNMHCGCAHRVQSPGEVPWERCRRQGGKGTRPCRDRKPAHAHAHTQSSNSNKAQLGAGRGRQLILTCLPSWINRHMLHHNTRPFPAQAALSC